MEITIEKKMEIIDYFLENAKLYAEKSPYAKVPMFGFSGFYFVSPSYGHGDYNKWRACDIEGNEDFCRGLSNLWSFVFV